MSVRRSSRLQDREEKLSRAEEVVRKRKSKIKRKKRIVLANERSTSSCDSVCSSPSPDQRGTGSSSEVESCEFSVVIPTPDKRVTPKRPNNLIRVHNSYNRDYGLDLYEGDFIDDRDEVYNTPSRPRDRRISRLRCSSENKGSSSSKGVVLSSNEEEASASDDRTELNRARDSADSDQINVVGRRTLRKRMYSSAAQLSTSEEEDEVKMAYARRLMNKKQRRIFKDSDDEINPVPPTKTIAQSRTPSVRAAKLKEEKEKKSAKLLERFKAQRESGAVATDISADDMVDDSLTDSCRAFLTFIPDADDQEIISLAEKLLFPQDNIDSSGAEDSDWIVSDGEDDYFDVKEMLRNAEVYEERILYHTEAEVKDVEDSASVLEDLKPISHIPRLPLHEAVCGEDGSGEEREALKKALELCKEPGLLDVTNSQGYTALMCAAERGDDKSARLLLEAGAVVNARGNNAASALHLAALSGWQDCVQLLISHGHIVDCIDERGWPPILYAHFKDHEDCVLALLKAKPQQFSVLGDLLKQNPQSEDEEAMKNTLKVVQSLLVSLAHDETYYSIFNNFVRDHPSILEDDGFRFMKHCMALLSFQNKQTWFRQKLMVLRDHASMVNCSSLYLHNVSRDDLLHDLWTKLKGKPDIMYWKQPFAVTFKGEAGICSGPRKEFLACLAKCLARGDGKLFCVCDDNHLSLQPCSLLHRNHQQPLKQELLDRHQELLVLVGMVVAHAVFHDHTPALHLTLPLLKQLLGLPLVHPADLEDVDKSFYHVLLERLLADTAGTEGLELNFTHTICCPWTGKTIDVPLCEGGQTMEVTEQNKTNYVELLSRFKLEGCVKQEIEAFTSGFWKVLPQKCLQVFTPCELALLLSGVPHIDVEDWRKNTRYNGLCECHTVVQWFWRLVKSLKEEERALLLQFATGSPCLPVGGFADLKGLGGVVPFTITLIPGKDKIPQSSTCFNSLKMTDYSSEQQLRNKMLIAIRYGCEGFEFS